MLPWHIAGMAGMPEKLWLQLGIISTFSMLNRLTALSCLFAFCCANFRVPCCQVSCFQTQYCAFSCNSLPRHRSQLCWSLLTELATSGHTATAYLGGTLPSPLLSYAGSAKLLLNLGGWLCLMCTRRSRAPFALAALIFFSWGSSSCSSDASFSSISWHHIQTQPSTDRLHSSAVSPRSVRQGLKLGATDRFSSMNQCGTADDYARDLCTASPQMKLVQVHTHGRIVLLLLLLCNMIIVWEGWYAHSSCMHPSSMI